MTKDTATIREVYQIVQRLEDKFDHNIQKQDERIDGIDQRTSHLEGRAMATGGIAGGIGGIISGIVVGLLTYFGNK